MYHSTYTVVNIVYVGRAVRCEQRLVGADRGKRLSSAAGRWLVEDQTLHHHRHDILCGQLATDIDVIELTQLHLVDTD